LRYRHFAAGDEHAEGFALRGVPKPWVQWILFRVVYGYYVLLQKTCRFHFYDFEPAQKLMAEGKGFLFAVAHCSLLPSVLSIDGTKALFVASRSQDGKLIGEILEKRGFEMVHGSSSRGGAVALMALHKGLRRGLPLGITFDGPKGPPLVPKPGVADLAQSKHCTACYFVSTTPASPLSKKLTLKLRSWDRFMLPLPFARYRVQFVKIQAPPNSAQFLEELQDLALSTYQAHYL
jgi:lysophospholipid acyltransferase (LPLAT)-like uncharacterized protein